MFPREMIEAGRIDGLSEIGVFFRIYVPTMKTTYAAASIITFMASWNNYIWPLIVLQSPENQTIPLLISNLGSSYSPDFGIIMLAIVIATIPTALSIFPNAKTFRCWNDGISQIIKRKNQEPFNWAPDFFIF